MFNLWTYPKGLFDLERWKYFFPFFSKIQNAEALGGAGQRSVSRNWVIISGIFISFSRLVLLLHIWNCFQFRLRLLRNVDRTLFHELPAMNSVREHTDALYLKTISANKRNFSFKLKVQINIFGPCFFGNQLSWNHPRQHLFAGIVFDLVQEIDKFQH